MNGIPPEPLLEVAFGARIPGNVRALVGNEPVEAFQAGPILSSSGRHRFYCCRSRHAGRFDTAVHDLVPEAGPWLAAAPRQVRRMLDTDGTFAEAFLDDLHLHGSDVVCHVVDQHQQRGTFRMIRHLPPAFQHLHPLLGLGNLAWRDGSVQHLLWVPERGPNRDARAHAIARELGLLVDAYLPLMERPGVGIDGIDIRSDGLIDLTPGFLEDPWA